MHVGFLTLEYPPLPTGGIGTSMRSLGRALVAQGHRVTVVGWGPKLETEDEGVRVRFLGDSGVPRMGWLLNRWAVRKELVRLVEKEGLDLVATHDWYGPSAGLSLPCPVAVHLHGSATYFAHLLGEEVRPAVHLAESVALRRADGLASVSRFTAETTRRLFGLEKPIEVIPNSVEVERFRPGRAHEVEPGVVLYFGTLVRKKGVLDLGPVFSEIVRRNPAARLRLVGRDSPDRQTGSPSTWELLAASLSPAARARTEYMGARPFLEVHQHVRRAAVCVFPSYAEALPLAWMEAMACGRPMVAYDIGWAPELVRSGMDGLLVPLGKTTSLAEAALSVLADPGLGRSLGEAARARAESGFSSAAIARRTAEWYGSLIA
ncbi:MAG TPA: glycosyltransferase family 4 protein [Thermoanaerobaculia bacterium]|nr:glycosyltransferase family 4 protein [Thermoanaerobaculia bacterium]